MSLNIQIDKFVYHSDLKQQFLRFVLKKFELHGNQITLTEIVNLSHREFHHLYKNR